MWEYSRGVPPPAGTATGILVIGLGSRISRPMTTPLCARKLILSRMSGVSPTTISLFLRGKRELRPALAVRLVEGLERAFVRKGSRLDTAFFTTDGHL